MTCAACGSAAPRPGCLLCGEASQAANHPVVGLVVPVAGGLPQELPVITTAMVTRVQGAVARDRMYADAKLVAARLRRQLAANDPVASEEVEILIAYFLDAK